MSHIKRNMDYPKYLLSGFTLLLIYLAPFLILQQEACHDPHDSLDYYVSIMTAADKSGDLLNLDPNSIVESVLGGVPRSFFHNNFDLMVFLFAIFPPFVAFLINFCLVHIIAYFGMYYFLNNHILKDKSKLVITLSAFLFSILPLYPMLGITLAGVPMVLNVFFNIYKRSETWFDFLVIIFFAFYSSIIYVGIFLLIPLGVWFLIEWIKSKIFHFKLFFSIALFGISYCIFNYHLFYQVFFSSQISHREEWAFVGYNWKVVAWAIKNIFINGHHHAASLHLLVLILIIPTNLVLAKIRGKFNKRLFILLVAVILVSFFYGLSQWTVYIDLKEKYKILKIFQWDRFYFFNPSLWSVILAIALSDVLDFFKDKQLRTGVFIVILFTVIQTVFVISHDKFYQLTYASLFGKKNELVKERTYRSYFQEDLFAKIAEYIGKPKDSYKVGAVGLNTAILQYNGFYTVDGYMTSYPLSYKHKFRKVIAEELEKDKALKAYYDDWGHRCYLFSHDDRTGKERISDLRWNFEELSSLGCEYVFSYKEIDLSNIDEMKLDTRFISSYNQKVIYLYKLI